MLCSRRIRLPVCRCIGNLTCDGCMSPRQGFVIVSSVPRPSAGEGIVAVADTKTGPVLWNRLDEQASYPDLCA